MKEEKILLCFLLRPLRINSRLSVIPARVSSLQKGEKKDSSPSFSYHLPFWGVLFSRQGKNPPVYYSGERGGEGVVPHKGGRDSHRFPSIFAQGKGRDSGKIGVMEKETESGGGKSGEKARPLKSCRVLSQKKGEFPQLKEGKRDLISHR